jgi:RND superfamily putative drug exporter
MLGSIARLAIRFRKTVLAVFILFVAVAATFGGSVTSQLSANGGFDDPASESSRALVDLQTKLAQGRPQMTVVVSARNGAGVDAQSTSAAGTQLTRELTSLVAAQQSKPDPGAVTSYWTAGSQPTLRSKDGKYALILARLAMSNDQAVRVDNKIKGQVTTDAQTLGLSAQLVGLAPLYGDVTDRVETDLVRAEAIAIPITAVLLILVFGSAVSALMPLTIGGLAVLGTMLTLRVVASFTDVSVYSVNLATSLGLGLGIDYGLFILTRYREELRKGATRDDAIVMATQRAGRTITVSALTIAASLAALMVFPLFFLRSFGYTGIALTFFAAIGAVVVLPALMSLLGPTLDRFDLRSPIRRVLRLREPQPIDAPSAFWRHVAQFVMSRAVVSAAVVTALLIVLGLPFLSAKFGQPDDRVLPASAAPHVAADVLRADFSGTAGETMFVVAAGQHVPAPRLTSYATTLSRLSGVGVVETATGTYAHGNAIAHATQQDVQYQVAGGTWLLITPTVESYTPQGVQLVNDVRNTKSPFGSALVGGNAPFQNDAQQAIGHTMPLALALIALATFVVLFLFTGSLVLPVKAIIMSLLSLSAMFGVIVWGFQDGHLASLLGFQVTGFLDTTTPILMLCVVFGLSMDYEVFLLSRIKEEWDLTGSNDHAVAAGLERTGRIVTAAAILVAIVFLAIVSSSITFIKVLGLGSAVAIVIDATLVRGVLVPSLMKIMGRWNWWAPAPLRALHARIGIKAHE